MVLFLRFLGIYQEATREMCFVFNPNWGNGPDGLLYYFWDGLKPPTSPTSLFMPW